MTEQGNPEDVRQVLNIECGSCTKEFRFLNELCLKCLSKSFEKIHHFGLVDGIRAFSQAAAKVKDSDEWGLKKAKRHPVILIVDEVSFEYYFYGYKSKTNFIRETPFFGPSRSR